MKILIAIESSENPKLLARTTLRWAARAGFNMRIFIPDENQRQVYLEAVTEANWKWRLDLPDTVIEAGIKPKEYAKQEGYDLIVYLPEDMRKWKPIATHDRNVLEYARDIGLARLSFGKDPAKKAYQFVNGAAMERV